MNSWELPYLKCEVAVGSSMFGYGIVNGGSSYKGMHIRNRIIYRVDIIKAMQMFFTKDSLAEYRDLIFYIVSGLATEAGSVTDFFKNFYCTDEVFKRYIGEVYYFREEAEVSSLYNIMILDFAREYKKRIKMFEDNELLWDYKFLFEDRGSVYLAGRDANKPLKIPEGYEEEVLSVGKVWKGDFERVKSSV